uniref:Coiled-coil and C2 domain-containing protein 1B n=1 Tax=Erpetoichthys calabaricus TaxID=27687 RepID=A0A8C4TDV0_ERPCA
MLGRRNKKPPHSKGQGAEAAKKMGLFMDFNADDLMMDLNDADDEDLHAELAAITGKKSAENGKAQPKGKTPLPMEYIQQMAENCMKDVDSEEEGSDDLENDEDLMAELQDMVGEGHEMDERKETTESQTTTESTPNHNTTEAIKPQAFEGLSACSSQQHTIESRIIMYKTAISNAKITGETSKVRRYERGLKTLENLLTSVKKGKQINEEEIPPAVATGNISSDILATPQPAKEDNREMTPLGSGENNLETEEHEKMDDPEKFRTISDSPLKTDKSFSPMEITLPVKNIAGESAEGSNGVKELLVSRQKEYKIAALKAKKEGDLEKAKEFMKIGKKFDTVITAMESGHHVDLSNIPPHPEALPIKATESPVKQVNSGVVEEIQAVESTFKKTDITPQPKDILDALQQRMDKYREASAQAKASGNDRKARMHERIVKQYQDAIRLHKAGKAVNFAELPNPPGFPPIPGMEAEGTEQGITAVLEAANRLVNDEEKDDEDIEEEKRKQTAVMPQKPKKPMLAVPSEGQLEKQPSPQQPRKPSSSPLQQKKYNDENLPHTVKEQLEFLENYKKKYMKAALQAKQRNDLEKAKNLLRTAKGIDPMLEALKAGKSVDISKLPSPVEEDEDSFIIVSHSDVQKSEKSEEIYTQLLKMLKEQYEKCVSYSKQFTHIGNIAETTKFEKMAEGCKTSLGILKLAQAQGLEPPKHHFEERTYQIVRIFPELSSTDMQLLLVKGINLPAPHGVAPNDLDSFVKFEFPYPSGDQAQKNKTHVIRNTNFPEYNQRFILNINRNHRGFKRVIQSKSIKFEVFHKGGFLRSDKLVGTAHVKLDKLETNCEVREIIELCDGRKPTGGRLEVRVQLREPLSGQDLQTVTERFLVLDQPSVNT